MMFDRERMQQIEQEALQQDRVGDLFAYCLHVISQYRVELHRVNEYALRLQTDLRIALEDAKRLGEIVG
jgi:hypothetical protein